jgi:hypothetical protein
MTETARASAAAAAAAAADEYHFGVPSRVIWTSHILMGLFFIYIGYAILTRMRIPTALALVVVVLGALGGLYHAHIWYAASRKKKNVDMYKVDM